MLGALRVIPALLAFFELCNTALDFAGVQCSVLSIFGGVSLLPLMFIYLVSYVFGFCIYHRMFLHYILATDMLNLYDFYFGIPVSDRTLFAIHCMVTGVSLFLVIYLYLKSHVKSYQESPSQDRG